MADSTNIHDGFSSGVELSRCEELRHLQQKNSSSWLPSLACAASWSRAVATTAVSTALLPEVATTLVVTFSRFSSAPQVGQLGVCVTRARRWAKHPTYGAWEYLSRYDVWPARIPRHTPELSPSYVIPVPTHGERGANDDDGWGPSAEVRAALSMSRVVSPRGPILNMSQY